MKKFAILVFFRVAICAFVQVQDESLQNFSVCFFSDKFRFKPPRLIEASEIPGRFLTASPDSNDNDKSFDLSLLEDCANFVMATNKTKKKIVKFTKNLKLKADLNNKKKDATKVEASLKNLYCIHAISACDFEDLGENFLKNLFIKYPEMARDLVDQFSGFEDYSFLNTALVDVIYAERNILMRPFVLENLVSTVSVEILVHLLEMWNFDLLADDVQNVLNVWGTNSDFLNLVEKDPRSWLLWKKAGLVKPFPMDHLIEIITVQNSEKYSDLILAWILDGETVITAALGQMELIYADIHKNDFIEETYMTPEMIEALDSRKWNLWRERSQPAFDRFTTQMSLKSRFIKKLVNMMNEVSEPVSYLYLSLLEFAILLQPLCALSRKAYNRSGNVDEVIAAMDNVSFYTPYYVPFVRLDTLLNIDFWTFLWKQIEVLGIEIAYHDKISLDNSMSRDILDLILERFKRMKMAKNDYSGAFWYSQLIIFASDPQENSDKVIEALIEINRNTICEIQPHQLNFLRRNIAIKQDMSILEVRDYPLDCFKYAPQLLDEEDIEYLLNDSTFRGLMKAKAENLTKLRTLSSFSAEDLKEFIPIGFVHNLEDCEALYTLKPDVLSGYLQECENAINNPERLVWQAHPDCWMETSFADLIAGTIPFDVLVKHPNEAEKLKLHHIMTDIIGRLQRRGAARSPQSLIIKWIVQMEWLYLQAFNNFFLELNHEDYSTVQYNKILKSEKTARADLITWLNSQTDLEDSNELLQLVSKNPISMIRIRKFYEKTMDGTMETLSKSKKKLFVMPTFEILTAKPIYKVHMSDLEKSVSDSICQCSKMIEKHLQFAEKQIWRNRLVFANIPTIKKYLIHLVPSAVIKRLFISKTSPRNDLRIASLTYFRFGYIFAPGCINTTGRIIPNPDTLKSCEVEAAREEKVIMDLRMEMIRLEMANRINNKK